MHSHVIDIHYGHTVFTITVEEWFYDSLPTGTIGWEPRQAWMSGLKTRQSLSWMNPYPLYWRTNIQISSFSSHL